MPQLIEYLDKFARRKQRDVLMLRFIPPETTDIYEIFDVGWEKFKPRVDVIAWLDANKIEWCPCTLQGGCGKEGYIYVDVPFDTGNPEYQKLAAHMENPDGTMKLEGVNFVYLPLSMAMEYACQDEPGYWEKYWECEFGGEIS